MKENILLAQRRTKFPDTDTAGTKILETYYLSKSYGDVKALDNVSFSLEKGEIFGLIGPNGAGKTTLLKILATLLKPDDGTIIIDGIPLENKRAIRKIIGYTPDAFGVYEELLVCEYLEFFVRAYYMEKDLQSFIIKESMETVGITDLANKPVEGLSRGMKQRISLARALLNRPKLLLLDEPASGLDPSVRLELREILKSLRRKGITIFISSHVLSDLGDICDRIGIMQDGKMTHIDTTKNLLSAEKYIRVRLKVSEREREAMSFLKSLPEITEALWDGNDIIFNFKDEKSQLPELTKSLVMAKIPVLTIQIEDATLEDVYLNITSKGRENNEQAIK